MQMIKLKDILTEGKGKQIGSMWNGIKKENAKIRADAINKANKKIEKNLQKLVGVRVWDNKVKVSGTIKSVKFDNKIIAKPDSMGFVNAGEVNKFSAVIKWHSGKTQVVTGPYLFGDEPIYLDKI